MVQIVGSSPSLNGEKSGASEAITAKAEGAGHTHMTTRQVPLPYLGPTESKVGLKVFYECEQTHEKNCKQCSLHCLLYLFLHRFVVKIPKYSHRYCLKEYRNN